MVDVFGLKDVSFLRAKQPDRWRDRTTKQHHSGSWLLPIVTRPFPQTQVVGVENYITQPGIAPEATLLKRR